MHMGIPCEWELMNMVQSSETENEGIFGRISTHYRSSQCSMAARVVIVIIILKSNDLSDTTTIGNSCGGT